MLPSNKYRAPCSMVHTFFCQNVQIKFIHCVSKKVCHFYFHDNFGKRELIFNFFFTVKVQQGSEEEDAIKTSTYPQICCHTTL